jgi:hypothetical protein
MPKPLTPIPNQASASQSMTMTTMKRDTPTIFPFRFTNQPTNRPDRCRTYRTLTPKSQPSSPKTIGMTHPTMTIPQKRKNKEEKGETRTNHERTAGERKIACLLESRQICTENNVGKAFTRQRAQTRTKSLVYQLKTTTIKTDRVAT